MIDNKQHIADFLTYTSHGTYNLQLFFPIYVSAPIKLAMTDFFSEKLTYSIRPRFTVC
jgi:hypothetical protein